MVSTLTMPFIKGTSGNASGRPKGAAGLARYIAERTKDGHELVDRLLALSRSESAPVRDVAAATLALLDRLVGKPMQPAELALSTTGTPVPGRDFSSLPIDERRELLARLRAVPELVE